MPLDNRSPKDRQLPAGVTDSSTIYLPPGAHVGGCLGTLHAVGSEGRGPNSSGTLNQGMPLQDCGNKVPLYLQSSHLQLAGDATLQLIAAQPTRQATTEPFAACLLQGNPSVRYSM